jgi:phospholipid transport system transporter-binding protein
VAQVNLTLMGEESAVAGELIRTTINKPFEKKSNKLFSSAKMTVDLSRVKKVDTAGLAWLLHIVEQANLNACQLIFINIPQDLLKLATLSGVDSFIPK